MGKARKTLNVLYQSDDNYAMVSGISIVSLLENNQHLDEINVYYCNYKIQDANQKNLQDIVSNYKNASLHFVETEQYHQTFQDLGVRAWHGLYVTWLKLLAFGDLPINTDRVLFINGHTIINGALDELIELDFEYNVMAMAYDCLFNAHKQAIGLDDNDGYFNAGIMLINHDKWTKEKISERIKQHLAEKSDYEIADQDLCSVMFRGQIKLLDSTYNFSSAYYSYDLKRLLRINNLKPEYFYSYEELMANYYSPKLIHSLFGITGKPWEQGNEHPQRYLWEKYIAMTPWKDTSRPFAKKNLNWRLYKLLPNALFMVLYKIGVKRKFSH
jgi:lipopolysaccharide biosynthesis glycosyltransferase